MTESPARPQASPLSITVFEKGRTVTLSIPQTTWEQPSTRPLDDLFAHIDRVTSDAYRRAVAERENAVAVAMAGYDRLEDVWRLHTVTDLARPGYAWPASVWEVPPVQQLEEKIDPARRIIHRRIRRVPWSGDLAAVFLGSIVLAFVGWRWGIDWAMGLVW